jgi:hypothetical protein
MARTSKQRWLISCASAAGVLVMLCGFALGGLLMFMKWLQTVPSESTQIVLYNDTDERLRIDKIFYGEKQMFGEETTILQVHDPKLFTQDTMSFFAMQPEMSRKLSIWYTGISSGEQWNLEVVTQRISDRPCKFVAFLRKNGGELSSCGYNELQDFEND